MKQEIKDLPTISVIVPVYNAEKTLRQCVDSILMQEYRNFELILVDDGSKDTSPQICDEYAAKDNRVKVFHKANGGVSSARNLGLDHAQGEWITFIDSDDYVTSNYFELVESSKEFDIIIKEFKWMRGDKSWIDNRVKTYNSIINDADITFFLNRYLTTMFFRGNVSKFYKKKCITGIRFNEKMKVGEDANFVHLCLLRCNSLLVLHNSYYCVRLSEDSPAKKYSMSSEYAITSLNNLYESFNLIKEKWGLNKGLFLSYFTYFKSVSRNDWKRKPSKWYRNHSVKQMYSYLWSDIKPKDRIKYMIVRLLSIFW